MKHILSKASMLAVFTFYALMPGASWADKPKTTIHRQWVTQTDAAGHYPAQSTEGDFSITSPIPFNDYTIRVDDPNIGEIVLHGIGSKSEDGFEFGAIQTRLSERSKDADLDNLIRKTASRQHAHLVTLERKKLNGEEIVLSRLKSASRNAFMRASKITGSTFVVICDFPADQMEIGEEICMSYLNSFKLKH